MLSIDEIDDIESVGGSPILTYSLEWDNGSNGSEYSVYIEFNTEDGVFE